MRSLLFAIFTGLIGALLIHVLVILAVPYFSGLDAYSRVVSSGAANEFHTLPPKANQSGLSGTIPFLQEAVCPIDLFDGPIRITAEGHVNFWSTVIYDTNSNEVFSLNDRISINGQPQLIIGTSDQIARIRNSDLDVQANFILVTLKRPEGFAVLRALAAETSQQVFAKRFLKSATCDEFED